jgi:crotonobetainyl-CoA:carnitine CoA-transferase CaiB-like acyl-CoA transferase
LGLNFRADGASDLIRKLAAQADVLVEGFRPGTLEKMGLAPEVLHADRVQHREEVDAIVGAWVGAQTRDQALKAFADAAVTAAPVYDIADLLADEHAVGRGIFEELPDDDLGWMQMHAPVPRLSATPAGYRRPAPRIGEHTWEVLSEFAFDEASMAALRDAGVVAGETR